MDTKKEKIGKLIGWLNNMDYDSKELTKVEYGIDGSIEDWIKDLDESVMDDIIEEFEIE